jgi:hypothetical protein
MKIVNPQKNTFGQTMPLRGSEPENPFRLMFQAVINSRNLHNFLLLFSLWMQNCKPGIYCLLQIDAIGEYFLKQNMVSVYLQVNKADSNIIHSCDLILMHLHQYANIHEG